MLRICPELENLPAQAPSKQCHAAICAKAGEGEIEGVWTTRVMKQYER